jgi:hypothetical protein
MGVAKRVGQVFSMASAMAGFALGGLMVATWVSESVIQPRWRLDDDWIWLMLPVGATVAMGLWLRFRHQAWIHILGVILLAWPVVSIVFLLTRPVPPGFNGLGASIGRAMAIVLAQVAAVTGVTSLVIATAFVAALAWYEARCGEDSA